MPPRLGLWTCLAIGGWMVACASTWRFVGEPGNSGFGAMWQAGLVFGLVSQGVWLTGAFRQRWLRWGAGSGCVIIGAGLASVQEADGLRSLRFLEEVAHLGGIAIAQAVVFFLLGVASWSLTQEAESRRPRQYTTLDLALLTVATGITLALARRQATPIDAPAYWCVMLGVWIGFPAIAALAAIAGTAASTSKRLLAASAATLLTAVACGGLVAMEVRYGGVPADQAMLMAQAYGRVLAAFLACCLVLPQAGRLDRILSRDRPPAGDDAEPGPTTHPAKSGQKE